MLVNKSTLGILNPMTSANKKFFSFQRGSTELIQAMKGVRELSNYGHLL